MISLNLIVVAVRWSCLGCKRGSCWFPTRVTASFWVAASKRCFIEVFGSTDAFGCVAVNVGTSVGWRRRNDIPASTSHHQESLSNQERRELYLPGAGELQYFRTQKLRKGTCSGACEIQQTWKNSCKNRHVSRSELRHGLRSLTPGEGP